MAVGVLDRYIILIDRDKIMKMTDVKKKRKEKKDLSSPDFIKRPVRLT